MKPFRICYPVLLLGILLSLLGTKAAAGQSELSFKMADGKDVPDSSLILVYTHGRLSPAGRALDTDEIPYQVDEFESIDLIVGNKSIKNNYNKNNNQRLYFIYALLPDGRLFWSTRFSPDVRPPGYSTNDGTEIILGEVTSFNGGHPLSDFELKIKDVSVAEQNVRAGQSIEFTVNLSANLQTLEDIKGIDGTVSLELESTSLNCKGWGKECKKDDVLIASEMIGNTMDHPEFITAQVRSDTASAYTAEVRTSLISTGMLGRIDRYLDRTNGGDNSATMLITVSGAVATPGPLEQAFSALGNLFVGAFGFLGNLLLGLVLLIFVSFLMFKALKYYPDSSLDPLILIEGLSQGALLIYNLMRIGGDISTIVP